MKTGLHADQLMIVDFGSQYTPLIARRVREMGVYCEIFSPAETEQALQDFAPKGVILSGGPESVTEAVYSGVPEIIFHLGCPVLGICYGMQAMAVQLGGSVTAGKKREFGFVQAVVEKPSHLLQGIGREISGKTRLDVWMSHGDHVDILPPGFFLTVSTDSCPIIGMADESRHFYGLQFHPEVSHTQQGEEILSRFVHEICGCAARWTTGNIIENSVAAIREKVGHEQVVLGLSGGVDSSVTAVLLQRALGDALVCILVDTGLMRAHEISEIETLFAKHFGMRLITVNAEEIFLSALSGVSDPEEKRKIVGRLFVEIFNAEAAKIGGVKWLAQGTIYPDVIESAAAGSGKSHVIKSHHNVGGLPEKMPLKLLEPLRELFKDEVRKMGLALGLPDTLVRRHPFPGPGLAIRVMGEIRREYLEILRKADTILIDALVRENLYDRVAQAFVVFLPVKSVGVMGDARHYAHVLAIRIVESVDFMTARAADLPYDFLSGVANRIVNEVHGVSRVVYDISGKPPATVEWE